MKLVTIFTNNAKTMQQNTYLYYDEATKHGALIDPGYNPQEEIMSAIHRHGVQPLVILLTHGHYDHIAAVQGIKDQTNARIFCHPLEKPMLEDPHLNLSVRTKTLVSLKPDQLLECGESLQIGDKTALTAIHTPGHTPGGLCFYDKKNATLFTGDTLFREGIGRTDLPGGNNQELLETINSKLLTLPNDVKVYPGHGRATTIGHEKKANIYFNRG